MLRQIRRFHLLSIVVLGAFVYMVHDSGRNADTGWFSVQVYFCIIQISLMAYAIRNMVKNWKVDRDYFSVGTLLVVAVLSLFSLAGIWTVYDSGLKDKISSCGGLQDLQSWAMENLDNSAFERRVEKDTWPQIVTCLEPKSVFVERDEHTGNASMSFLFFGGVLGGKWLVVSEASHAPEDVCAGGNIREWGPGIYSLYCPD